MASFSYADLRYSLLILHYNTYTRHGLGETDCRMNRDLGLLGFRAEGNQDRGAFCSMTPPNCSGNTSPE